MNENSSKRIHEISITQISVDKRTQKDASKLDSHLDSYL